jgi:hypothetical protein
VEFDDSKHDGVLLHIKCIHLSMKWRCQEFYIKTHEIV